MPALSKEMRQALRFEEEFLIQLILTILVLFGQIFTIYYSLINGYDLYQAAGLTLALLIFTFFLLFCHVIVTAENIYFMKFQRRRNPNIVSIFHNGSINKDMTKPMGSISGLIGIRGTNIEKTASSIFYTASGICTICYTIKLFEEYNDNFCWTNFYGIASSFGLWILTTWQVHDNKISKIIHYIGAIIFIYTSNYQFIHQQNWSHVSIYLFILNIILFLVWRGLKIHHLKYMSCVSSVYWKSIILISMESWVMLSSAICASLNLYNLGSNTVIL